MLLFLLPLVQGRSAGWPAWSWLCLGGCVLAGLALAAWEVRLARRGGEPVIQVDLLRHRSFAGQLLALLYFAGFTSLFFTLSGPVAARPGPQRSGRRAADAALRAREPVHRGQQRLVLRPFRPDHDHDRDHRKARRPGRGSAGCAPRRAAWLLAGPLAVAGLGNWLVIAPNQDFVLGSVPRRQAGAAGGELITAQRMGAAMGIAVGGPRCSAAEAPAAPAPAR
jgi:hypothetical protein